MSVSDETMVFNNVDETLTAAEVLDSVYHSLQEKG